jgi:hypothetical protein
MRPASSSTDFASVTADCPSCQRPLTPAFDAQLSGMPDTVIVAIDLLHDLKAMLERRAGL